MTSAPRDGVQHTSPREPACCFCSASAPRETHRGLYHPFKKDHGPFQFHRCDACGSGLTIEPPDARRLSALYASYRDGFAAPLRDMMLGDPQRAMYAAQLRSMLRSAHRHSIQIDRWIDVGAGGGELSRLLLDELPAASGVCVDLHTRPELLAGQTRIDWRTLDINEDFAEQAGPPAPLVFSSAVWEHVLHPDRYARNLIRLVAPGGMLYLMTPDYGSLASRVLGERWPYFEPGEHLNMPTIKGARECLLRQWREVNGASVAPPTINCDTLWLPYTIRYTLQRIGLGVLGRLIPAGLAAPLPTGVLEATLLSPTRA